jgi:opacity protein-like surface antigen
MDMKRCTVLVTILSVLVLMTFATLASAQVTWSAGVKGGINLSTPTGDDAKLVAVDSEANVFESDIDGYRTGFLGGGFVTAKIHENFGVRLEALFAQKGGKGELTDAPHTQDYQLKVDYVEIPLLAIAMFPAHDKATVHASVGPTISFNTNAKEIWVFDGEEGELDIDEITKSTDFGITLGAGIDVKVHERVTVIIDARYNRGLTKVQTDGDGQDIDIKNSAFGIMAGLSFPFGVGGGEGS